MNSIERARKAIHRDACTNANLAEAFGAGGDALIAETLEAVFDAIESELDECYMELPVDADGVPIHIGDLLASYEYGGKQFQCIGLNIESYGEGIIRRTVCMNYDSYSGTGEYTPAIRCHHVKPRTVEDVLHEFVEYVTNGTNVDSYEKDIADYAAEIRELMKGEGE